MEANKSENPKGFCKCGYLNPSWQAYKRKKWQKFFSFDAKCIPYLRLQLSRILNCYTHYLGNLQVIRWNFITSPEKYLLYVGVLSHVFKP